MAAADRIADSGTAEGAGKLFGTAIRESFSNEKSRAAIESDYRDREEKEHGRVHAEEQRSLFVDPRLARELRFKRRLKRTREQIEADAVIAVAIRLKLTKFVRVSEEEAFRCAGNLAKRELFGRVVDG